MIGSMQAMRVESVHLARFKGFQNFRMDCSPFTALVGLNNGGKTSILQAIRLVMDIFMFTFGRCRNKDAEQPDFANPQWASSPMNAVNRMAFADPESLWLRKMTSEPCNVTLCFPACWVFLTSFFTSRPSKSYTTSFTSLFVLNS